MDGRGEAAVGALAPSGDGARPHSALRRRLGTQTMQEPCLEAAPTRQRAPR